MKLSSSIILREKDNSLKIIWFFIKPYKFQFFILFSLGIIMGLFELLNLALLYPILSYSTTKSFNNENFIFNFINIFLKIIPINDILIANSLMFIIFAFLSFITGIVYVILSLRLTSRITIENKQKIYSKFINSDYQFFVDNKQGDILYKTTRAPGFISDVFNNLTRFGIEIILSISTLILLISISFKMTILVIVVGISYYIFTNYLSKKISYMTGTGRYHLSQKENVLLNESINGIKQIKTYRTFSYWKKQYDDTVAQFWMLWRKDSFWLQVPTLMLYLLIFISIGSIIIYIRIYDPDKFILYIPLIGTFSLAVLRLLPRLSNFGTFWMGIMSALPNLEVVHKVMIDKTYSTILNGDRKLVTFNSNIKFETVKFNHKNRGTVLNGISLNIDKGKIIAIVGPSGSGKSTIVDLLLRLYDVNEGAVTIDNINIKEYDISSILDKIGFVSQETFIYNASIKENITFGKAYSFPEVMEAAKLANAHNFIQQSPQGYDTMVGDRGIKLSGGEKQRVAIARAIIRKPEILILDEATSSLDNISEKVVQEAINNVSKNCTTLIIAHRLSTVQNADIIYLLDDGRIRESGNHEQLMDQKGKYWEMYNIQKE